MPLMRRGPGLIGTAARSAVYAGVSGRVQRRQQQRWAEEDAAAYGQQQQYAQPPQQQYAEPAQAQQAEPDYTAELERLADLRDRGVITPEDFDAKKRQLLGI